MKHIFTAAAFSIALGGCASIFSGTTTDVAIRTTPGAKYTVTNAHGSSVASGVVGDDAVARFNLVRGAGYFSPHAYKVKFSKDGHKPTTVPIDPSLNPLYFGNILIASFIGMVIVDPLTGAMYRMIPGTEVAELEPNGEDPEASRRTDQIIQRAKTYQVSRNEYSAREVAQAAKCRPVANPQIIKTENRGETLIFSCENGNSFAVDCNSLTGCR